MRTVTRRALLQAGAGLLLGAQACQWPRWTAGLDARRPNLLIIYVDDLGYGELSCYAGERALAPTPQIDRIAATGVRFTDGYVTAPICSPSRASLLTGRYSQSFGYYGNPDAMAGLPREVPTLAECVKPAGYATAWIGKSHLGWNPESNPQRRGWDTFFGFRGGFHDYFRAGIGHNPEVGQGLDPVLDGETAVPEIKYLTEEFTDRAITFIEQQQAKPFCLYLAYNALHSPEQAPKAYLDRFNRGANPEDRRRLLSALE